MDIVCVINFYGIKSKIVCKSEEEIIILLKNLS